ncbi:MAG: flagellar motor switch protein FliN/FliY [Gammaproteobacteria bacterium]|jgi:flagellar motor switch protein FliN/FliY
MMSTQNEGHNEALAGVALALPSGVAMNLVKDIPVTLSIELGRTRMTLKDLLELEQGAVIELERMVDEPMDVLVNGTLVAHGEVVVINDTFGVRLTDVAGPDS